MARPADSAYDASVRHGVNPDLPAPRLCGAFSYVGHDYASHAETGSMEQLHMIDIRRIGAMIILA
jgi:hypothetical protein